MIIRDYHNISNFFVETKDVSKDLTEVLSKMRDSIFGIEVGIAEGAVNTLIIAPPYVRLREYNAVRFRECPTGDFKAYEGSLSRPFFLPLYGALRGDLLDDLSDIVLPDKDRLYVQWLFRRKDPSWKDKALDMYDSYLRGNDYPAARRIGRKLQDKALGVLNRIMPFPPNEYVDEVEDKLLSEGFQFQLRVAIQSDQVLKVLDQLVDILKKYDAHNALKLYKTNSKHFIALYRDCILTADTSEQILSSTELFSLLGGKATASTSEAAPVKAAPAGQSIIDLLPLYPREEIQVDDSLPEQIAGALKRVGLIKQARLYNESITAGIRLTVIQADIPKGKKLTEVIQRSTDIQAALGVSSLGIEQGTTPDTVKFVLPNDNPAVISLRELLELSSFQEYAQKNPLAFAVGVDEINQPLFLSLTKLVHLLVAGTTGSGKSVFVNSLIVALMTSYTPEQLRFLMIDPKEVELSQYIDFPHVDDVVTDMDKAYAALESLVEEMEDRYSIFRENGVKNITLYNQKMEEPMPYIVCVVDEYADLRDTHKEVEDHIARLGQKARAAGIHLVIATQRPSVNIISGRIKANIPNTISFNLTNNTNYKTVFGRGIPYNLLGRGDGVMKIEGQPKEFQRFQSAILSPDEAEEGEIYRSLAEYYLGNRVNREEEDIVHDQEVTTPVLPQQDEEVTPKIPRLEEDEDSLYQLRQIIANTRETRVDPLRKLLGVKTSKMKELMTALTEEGWLQKPDERSKGYQLIASDSMLSEWKTET